MLWTIFWIGLAAAAPPGSATETGSPAYPFTISLNVIGLGSPVGAGGGVGVRAAFNLPSISIELSGAEHYLGPNHRQIGHFGIGLQGYVHKGIYLRGALDVGREIRWGDWLDDPGQFTGGLASTPIPMRFGAELGLGWTYYLPGEALKGRLSVAPEITYRVFPDTLGPAHFWALQLNFSAHVGPYDHRLDPHSAFETAFNPTAVAQVPIESIPEPDWDDSGKQRVVTYRVQDRITPEYPMSMRRLHGDERIRCVARVRVGVTGTAERVAITDCPEGFHLAAVSAISRWKWAPPKRDGKPIRVETSVRTGFLITDQGFTEGYASLDDTSAVTGDLNAPVLIKSGSLPEYPRQVTQGGHVCALAFTVTQKGKTTDIRVGDCPSVFADATVEAVERWTFFGRFVDGEPASATVNTTITFTK